VQWGSDLIAGALRDTKNPVIALTPAQASGVCITDLVNHWDFRAVDAAVPGRGTCREYRPWLCKVAGEPMAVALHSKVGLMPAVWQSSSVLRPGPPSSAASVTAPQRPVPTQRLLSRPPELLHAERPVIQVGPGRIRTSFSMVDRGALYGVHPVSGGRGLRSEKETDWKATQRDRNRSTND
jgi:hypothetical protein